MGRWAHWGLRGVSQLSELVQLLGLLPDDSEPPAGEILYFALF